MNHEQRSAVNKVTHKKQFFNYKMKYSAKHFSTIELITQARSDVIKNVTGTNKIAKLLHEIYVKEFGKLTITLLLGYLKRNFT